MEKINQYLRGCDIFAQSPSLGMNHKSTYQSSFGGFTSIATIFLVFLFFSTNFVDYLAGRNIITKQTQVYDDTLTNMQLDDQDFIMALGIEQSNFLNQPYFTINLQQREYERLPNGTVIKNITQLPLVPCTLERFQSIFERYGKNISEDFQRLQLQNLLCPQTQISMNIGGTYTSNNFNFLKIEVTPCKQSTSTDRTCASDDEIKQQLEENGNFKVQVYVVNKVINPNKIGSDYISIFLDDQSYLSFVPKKITKQANIYFRQYQFQNNLDLYPFNEDQNLNFISIDNTETKEITDLGRDSDTIYAAFYFRKSPITMLIERKNQNVTDLLSKLGGLLQISLIVMGFIISAYNKITMFVELSNKIYEFSPDIEEQNKQHQSNLKLIDNAYEDKQLRQEYYVNREGQQQQIPNSEIKHKSKILRLFGKSQPDKHIMLIDRPTTENNEYINQGLNENEDKSNQNTQLAIKDHNILASRLNCVSGLDYFKKQINLILNRSQPLRFNMKIFLNQLCLRKAFSNSLSVLFYNQAVDKINEQLDVFNILTKLNEIDKLKEILLTNSQQLLFDFASKPIISMIEEKEIPISRTSLENRARNTNVSFERKRTRKSQVIQPNKSNNKSFFRTQSIDRDIRIYHRIYRAYDLILQQSADQHPQHEVNRKLIKKLGDEMQAIFKLSKLLDFDGIRRLRANSNIDLVCRNTQNLPEEIMNK